MSYTPGPLPFPPLCRDDTRHDEDYYTASQVESHAAAEVSRAVAAERERQQEFNAMASRLERAAAKLADEHELLRIESENTKAEALLLIRSAANAERERCAKVCEDEARIREEAGNTWPEESPERSRCFAGARAAMNCAKGVRNGEVVEAIRADPQRLQGKGE